MKRVLFICLGNICRSPTADGVFRQLVKDAGLEHQIEVDSAGTAAWHIGKSPDKRAQAAAKKRGYDLSGLRARQVSVDDFDRYDYLLAMDQQNLLDLRSLVSGERVNKPRLFLTYTGNSDFRDVDEVPDPYYGGSEGFDYVLDLVEDASQQLLREIQAAL